MLKTRSLLNVSPLDQAWRSPIVHQGQPANPAINLQLFGILAVPLPQVLLQQAQSMHKLFDLLEDHRNRHTTLATPVEIQPVPLFAIALLRPWVMSCNVILGQLTI